MPVKIQLSCFLLLLMIGCRTATDRERYGVPDDKRIFGKYYFDYNHDGIRDVLLIVEDSLVREEMKRYVWIFAGQQDSSLVRVLANEHAVPCANCTEIGDSTLSDVVVTDTSISYRQTVITKNDRCERKRFRFEYTNYRKWHLVAVDYTLDCTDADGKVVPGCVTAMKFNLEAQDLLPPVYLDDFDIYDFSPLQAYSKSEKINTATINFDVDRGGFYEEQGLFPDNLVLQNDNDKAHGTEWMFIFEREDWPEQTPGQPVDFNTIDLSKFDRYVVALDWRYVEIGKDAGGAQIYNPKFPCMATVYQYNRKQRQWDVFHRQKSFNSPRQIASYINSLQYHD